jgi:hypothetical protein
MALVSGQEWPRQGSGGCVLGNGTHFLCYSPVCLESASLILLVIIKSPPGTAEGLLWVCDATLLVPVESGQRSKAGRGLHQVRSTAEVACFLSVGAREVTRSSVELGTPGNILLVRPPLEVMSVAGSA